LLKAVRHTNADIAKLALSTLEVIVRTIAARLVAQQGAEEKGLFRDLVSFLNSKLEPDHEDAGYGDTNMVVR
jgi:hypothetical protein